MSTSQYQADIYAKTCDIADHDPGVEGAGITTWYDSSNDYAPVTRLVTVSDDGTATISWLDVAGNSMPFSERFTPNPQEIAKAVKFVTDLDTGSFREVTEVKNLSSGTVRFYDNTGAKTSISANEVVQDYVEPVPLGNQVITVTPGTPATLTVPDEARYAYLNINGADAMYAFGAPPVESIDHRVSDGGRVEIQSRDRLLSFQLGSLDGETSLSGRVYFYNTNPSMYRT